MLAGIHLSLLQMNELVTRLRTMFHFKVLGWKHGRLNETISRPAGINSVADTATVVAAKSPILVLDRTTAAVSSQND